MRHHKVIPGTHDKSSEYLHPFRNCTTMIFTPSNVTWNSITKPTLGPIVLLIYEGYWWWMAKSPTFRNFFLHRRLNFVRHCWATFVILPEKNVYFVHNMYFMQLPCFTEATWKFQYFIWITKFPGEIQKYMTRHHVLRYLGLREVLIVHEKNLMQESHLLRIDYHNMYHIHTPPVGVARSDA